MIRTKQHHVKVDKILKNIDVKQCSKKSGKRRPLQAFGRFWACAKNCENHLLALSCLPACLPVCLSIRPSVCRMEQLGSHWTDFYEILHLKYF
jgi:hypothetical protein